MNLPTNYTISLWWNLGSILGLVLGFQIISGLLLAIKYTARAETAFLIVNRLVVDRAWGSTLRILHFNGASLFFVIIYAHITKNLRHFCFRQKLVWGSGVILLFLLIIVAFLGYVLPWGQIRFWACTVITNLLGVVPFLGPSLVKWIWGGFRVNRATLSLFFVVHFIAPFILVVVAILHLVFLHTEGSSSILFTINDERKICFHPYFTLKDCYNFILIAWFFICAILFPWGLGDSEIFIEANRITSPIRIVPEWYFLFAYAILRSVPNKPLGVVLLVLRVLILLVSRGIKKYTTFFNKINKIFFFLFSLVWVFVALTWLGQCHVEPPFIALSLCFSILYFILVLWVFFYYNRGQTKNKCFTFFKR